MAPPIKGSCSFIFVTGGVSSSVGKGLATASIASLMQSMGLKVCIRKMDPYLNVDPGTMSPLQHGEVFVTDDGAESDLDLGHYERFTGIRCTRHDSITAGRIYMNLIERERRGDYLGSTVQVIPHVTNLIKDFIYNRADDYDVILCEIGGTVGDIEGQPFFEAIRQVAYEIGKENVVYVHLTLAPYLPSSGELKTKPTQHSVKILNALGIQPDFIICRTQEICMSHSDKKKIALFCNIKEGNVIEAHDVDNVYHIPILYKNQELDKKIGTLLGYHNLEADVTNWIEITKKVQALSHTKVKLSVAVIGKYSNLCDAYISVHAALKDAGCALGVDVSVQMVCARTDDLSVLSNFDAILVPGGFGIDGIEGKLAAVNYARINGIPFLGICLGFQIAVIEFARNVLGLKDASSIEFDPECKNPVICFMHEWKTLEGAIERRERSSKMGGTMRLGQYTCMLVEHSKAHAIYGGAASILERHRHRYEVNPSYRKLLEKGGMFFSGYSSLEKDIPEVLELKEHPWFIGVQFHPEFKSSVFKPHPLFCSFVEAGLSHGKKSQELKGE